jgi:UDP-N-acetylmuramate dehydrogenase
MEDFMKQIADKLTARISGAVRMNEPMSRHTSFKIGGPADLYIEPCSTAELLTVLRCLRQESVPVFILGNGTNLLVGDEGYRGAVLRLSGEFTRFQYEGNLLDAGSAVPVAKLALDACRCGLSGLEFAAGIPGTLGGALVMNAGAHGSAVSEVLVSADIISSNLELHTFAASELGLTYRKSNILPEAVVCRAKFMLFPGDREALSKTCTRHLAFRRERQPRQPNAGSIFKNPPEDAAGRLIEAAGLKGRRYGGAMISDIHANFIVNCGEAKAGDVLFLIALVKEEVQRQFGRTLELEIRLLGN